MRESRVEPDSLAEVLRRRASSRPEVVAATLGTGAALTYGSWDDASDRVAGALVDASICDGAFVALVFERSQWLDFVVALLGAQKARAVPVVVPLAVRGTRLERLLERLGVVAVVGSGGGESDGLRRLEYEALRDSPVLAAFSRPVRGDLAQVLFSSGTTGEPKPVAATHHNLLWQFDSGRFAGLGSAHETGRRIVTPVSLGTQFGQSLVVEALSGHQLVVGVLDIGVQAFVDVARRSEATDVDLNAALAVHLARRVGRDDPLPAVTGVWCTGSAVPAATVARLMRLFPNASYCSGYSTVEAWPGGTSATYDGSSDRIALADPGQEDRYRVLRDDGDAAGDGEPGRIALVVSRDRQRAYLHDDEANAATFVGDLVLSHDVGVRRADGRLYHLGRLDDVVTTGGLLVGPSDVEAAAASRLPIQDVVALALPHPTLGHSLAVAVAPADAVDEGDVRRALAHEFAGASFVSQVLRLDAIPRTGTGKPDVARLAALAGVEASRATGVDDERSAAERQVQAIWMRVLDVRSAAPGDAFVAAGGDSLLAADLLDEVREELGIDVSLADFFEAPTLQGLTEIVESRLVSDSRRARRRSRSSARPTS